MKSLKRSAQRLLKKIGLYHRIQASVLYDGYWRLADPRIIAKRTSELRFYRELLDGMRPGDRVFDIGANHGQKADIFLRMQARVVAVEPDPTNQEILRKKFLWLRLPGKPLVVVGKALSDGERTETMWVDAPGSAKNTLNAKWVETLRQDEQRFGERLNFATKATVETTTLDRLIATHGIPFYIKIDVEGHEPSVIRGLSQPVRFLSFEVNLPEFRPEGLECIKHLHQITPTGEFNYASDCQRGLALPKWLAAPEFANVFERINEPSVEVFWRTA